MRAVVVSSVVGVVVVGGRGRRVGTWCVGRSRREGRVANVGRADWRGEVHVGVGAEGLISMGCRSMRVVRICQVLRSVKRESSIKLRPTHVNGVALGESEGRRASSAVVCRGVARIWRGETAVLDVARVEGDLVRRVVAVREVGSASSVDFKGRRERGTHGIGASCS